MNQFLEPVVLGTVVLPDEYLGSVLQLCEVIMQLSRLGIAIAVNGIHLFWFGILGEERNPAGNDIH